MRVDRVALPVLWVLLALFLARGLLIALTIAPYSGHDEIAHYSYVRVLVQEHRLPLIPDLQAWRSAELDGGDMRFDEIPDEFYPWAGHFTTPDWLRGQTVIPRAITGEDGERYPSGWIYTANHPPLYYLWLVPVYALTDNLPTEQQLILLRIATIPFGLGTVVFAWLAARSLFRRDIFLRTLIPAFVALQPQIGYEASIVNNDIVAIMFSSGVAWLTILALKNTLSMKIALAIGLLLGLAVLGKTTAAILAVIIAATFVLAAGWRNWRNWLRYGAVTAGIAAIVISPWQIFMWLTYGNATALPQVAALQTWWNDIDGEAPTILGQLFDPTFFWFRWKETWGEFGWRLIELDGYMAEVYGIGERKPMFLAVLLALTIIDVCGGGVGLVRARRDRGTGTALHLEIWQWQSIELMLLACVLGYYSVLQFGLTFRLTQARYYFPMIVPAAIVLMCGYRALFADRWLRIGSAIIFLSLVVVNVMIYTAWVLPYWHPMAGAAAP